MSSAVLEPVAEETGTPHRLADGVELIGPYHGSGYRSPKYVVARPDGQVVQLSGLLFTIASELDGRTGCDGVARRVAEQLDRELSGADVDRLVRERLAPAGLVGDGIPEESPAGSPRPDHLLMLRLRTAVVPDRLSWTIAGVFRRLHHPVVVAVLLACAVGLDVTLLVTGGIPAFTDGALGIVAEPTLLLAVLALFVVSGMFHECGHVSACRYGGARPGTMGVGIYLVWPAFYSTVTDSYRLSRAGRLRTDLGGVYFNGVFIGVLVAVYLSTGASWLLVAVLALHLETARQFLPMIRLDGYYILSDLIGLPDLFTFLGPVLRGMLPGQPADPRVDQLRPAVAWAIRAWVLAVVPFIAFFVVSFLVAAPRVVPEIATSVVGRLADAGQAWRASEPALVALGTVQALLLLLPVLGGAFIAFTVLRGLLRPLLRRLVVAAPPDGGSGRLPVAGFVLVGLVTLGAGLLGATAAGGRPATVPEALLTAPGLPDTSTFDVVAGRQLAAVVAVLGGPGQIPLGPARTACALLGVLAAVLLWPLCRRIGLPSRMAALAVVLAGVTGPAVVLHATVDAGALATVWLVAAAVLAGRGRAGNGVATVAAVLAAVTAPLIGVAVLAFVTHSVASGQLGARRLRPAGRYLTVPVAAACTVGAGIAVMTTSAAGTATAPGWPVLAGLIAGAAVVVLVWRFLRPLAPVATGAAVLLLLAALPGLLTTTLSGLVPVLAVLVAALVERAVPGERPAAARAALAVGAVLGIVTSAPLLSEALPAAPAPGPGVSDGAGGSRTVPAPGEPTPGPGSAAVPASTTGLPPSG